MPAFKIRGVIEGFYGYPWNQMDRINFIKFLGQNGMNTYVYAPKDDPYHRQKWRQLYPQNQIDAFSELLHLSQEANVSIIWALSPGLSLIYSSDTELDLLKTKFQAMQKIGFTKFGLFFDDIFNHLVHQEDVEKFSSLAEAQAFVANKIFYFLQKENPAVEIFFCPTEYMGEGQSDYLKELGIKLNPAVEIFWTGPQVCSSALELNNAQTISKTLRRKIVYWDNYPVNDAAMQPELHLGPYLNRDPKLSDYANGILLNPMDKVEASKIALYCAADFLNNPTEYNAESTWLLAIENLVGSKAKDAFVRFAKANSYSCLEPYEPKYLLDAVKRFEALISVNDWEGALKDASGFFTTLNNDLELLHELPASLVLEIKPWLDEYQAWIEIALSCLALGMELQNLQAEGAIERLIKARNTIKEGLLQAIDFKTYCCGDVIRNLAQKIYRATGYFLG